MANIIKKIKKKRKKQKILTQRAKLAKSQEKAQSANTQEDYEARLASVSARIGDRIPTVLELPEQSLFALGYYQMTAAMNQERRERFAKSTASNIENEEE